LGTKNRFFFKTQIHLKKNGGELKFFLKFCFYFLKKKKYLKKFFPKNFILKILKNDRFF